MANKYLYNGKELQPETGNLDYGWRQYDAAGVRWTGIDVKSEKYYPISPYAFVMNNPLKYNDQDGKDAIVAIKGNVITISSNIYLYGSGATNSTASQMQKDIMAKWDKGFVVKGPDGKNYSVKFDIKVSLYDGKEKNTPTILPESWNPNNRDNFVEVGGSLSEIGRSYVLGGDEGEWRGVGRGKSTLTEDDPAPHEFGHILGLGDRYDDKRGANKGWENNIMGDSKNGKVETRNINAILGDVMRSYGEWSKNKKNNGKNFRYEINVDRPDKENK